MKKHLAFTEFLKKEKSDLARISTLCFTSKADYPLLFFSRVIQHLKKNQDTAIQAVDISSVSRNDIVSKLETSFLGASTLYWLRDLSVLSVREQMFWYEYCARYAGPNSVWFFVQEGKSKHLYSLTIALPEKVDTALFVSICFFFDIPLTVNHKQFIAKLFAECSSIDLDSVCLLLEYMQCAGKNTRFFAETLPNLIPSDKSLFDLGAVFLSKKSELFYPQWRQLSVQYSEQFWCSFFSDILWRGAQYIRLAQENDMIAARKMAYRLPFSFIKSDWRKLKQSELVGAHAFICDIDFRFKNSAGYGSFDLFFSNFFLGDFTK